MADVITKCKCEQFEKSEIRMRIPVDLVVRNHYIYIVIINKINK